MNKILKFSVGIFVALVAVTSFASYANAMTTSASSCAQGAAYDTVTGKACADVTMNPPVLGYVPYGCDYGVGTVYSPETGESCSVNGVTITPPIVMMPPYDAYGCKVGSPYSMTTGAKCAGYTTSTSGATSASANGCTPGAMYSTTTGAKCTTTSSSSAYDCTVAKNAYCAGMSSTTTTTPPAWIPPVKITASSSVSDVMTLQTSLNKVLGTELSTSLVVDGRYGAKTRDAIRKFQIKAGLKADGVAGPLTLASLKTSASIQ